MIPKKIYLREAEFDDLFTSERMVSCDESYSDITVEFTNLSAIWHDVSEEPQIGSNIVVVDEDGQWWDIQPYDGEYDGYGDLTGWRCCVVHYNNIQSWAYIPDLLPKGGKL